MFNPQTFGKLRGYMNQVDCLGPNAVHVPLRFTAPISAAGAQVYRDTLDLSSFLRGAPSPFIEGIQSMIVIQNSKDAAGVLSNNSFLSEFTFNNRFKVMTPGRSYTCVSVIADNSPIIDWRVYTIAALGAPFDVEIDCYFTNQPMDQIHFTR